MSEHEFRVGDRVLVPGVVKHVDDGVAVVDLPASDDWIDTPVRDLRRDVPGGRDLTASIVITLMQGWRTGRRSVDQVTAELNRIARGDRPSEADDTAPSARVRHADDPLLHFARWVVSIEELGAGPAAPRFGTLRHIVRRAREAITAASPGAAGSNLEDRAGDTAPDDEQRRNRRLAERIASGSAPLDDKMIATMRQIAGANLNPAGPRVVQLLAEYDRLRSEVAANDEVIATLKSAYDHACADWRQRADELAAERDAARSEVAALRAVGNKLADKAELSSGVDVRARVAAWRSAAGGEQQ